jgi:hypothetical protein
MAGHGAWWPSIDRANARSQGHRGWRVRGLVGGIPGGDGWRASGMLDAGKEDGVGRGGIEGRKTARRGGLERGHGEVGGRPRSSLKV